jgi:hypothetical protein
MDELLLTLSLGDFTLDLLSILLDELEKEIDATAMGIASIVDLLKIAFETSKVASFTESKENYPMLRSILCIWMCWWVSDSNTYRVSRVTHILREMFLFNETNKAVKKENMDEIEESGLVSSEKNTFSIDASLLDANKKYLSSATKKISTFPLLTENTLVFFFKLTLSMIPALFTLSAPRHCANKNVESRDDPYALFVNVAKLTVMVWKELEAIITDKEEHIWLLLQTSTYSIKVSRAMLDGVQVGVQKCVIWRNNCPSVVDNERAIDWGAVEKAREVLCWALTVIISIDHFWETFIAAVITPCRFECPKSLLRSIMKLKQNCEKDATRLLTEADVLYQEISCMDASDISWDVLANEETYLDEKYLSTLNNFALSTDERFSDNKYDDRSLSGIAEETSSTKFNELYANGFAAIPANDDDVGWGLYTNYAV